MAVWIVTSWHLRQPVGNGCRRWNNWPFQNCMLTFFPAFSLATYFRDYLRTSSRQTPADNLLIFIPGDVFREVRILKSFRDFGLPMSFRGPSDDLIPIFVFLPIIIRFFFFFTIFHFLLPYFGNMVIRKYYHIQIW